MDQNPHQNVLWEIKFNNNIPSSVLTHKKTFLPKTPPINHNEKRNDILQSLIKMKEDYEKLQKNLSKPEVLENNTELLKAYLSSGELIKNITLFMETFKEILKNYLPPQPPPENPPEPKP